MDLRSALQYAEDNKQRLSDKGLSLVGVAYDSTSSSAAYKLFKAEFDPCDVIDDEGPWYCIEYYGGSLWEDGSSGEVETLGGETISQANKDACELYADIDSVQFYERKDIDIERYAEAVLPVLIDAIPAPTDYWPHRKPEYEKVCIDAISQWNIKGK